jgi:predicted nuclease of restriction endonuclease-like (RecB) superfamily
MRAFYLGWHLAPLAGGLLRLRARLPDEGEILQTPSAKSAADPLALSPDTFPLPWSHYVRLLSVENAAARRFYEEEATRGAWSVRQLDRQVNAMLYERTALSRNKAALLTKGQERKATDAVTVEEAIRDPYVLEFLGLKDEYAESDLEAALVGHLETFLLELGDDFCFVGRQRAGSGSTTSGSRWTSSSSTAGSDASSSST